MGLLEDRRLGIGERRKNQERCSQGCDDFGGASRRVGIHVCTSGGEVVGYGAGNRKAGNGLCNVRRSGAGRQVGGGAECVQFEAVVLAITWWSLRTSRARRPPCQQDRGTGGLGDEGGATNLTFFSYAQ